MEKAPYSKEGYDNRIAAQELEREQLRATQEAELKEMREDAQGEANDMQDKIDEHEAGIKELKGTKEGESVEKEKTQEKLKVRSLELPKEMEGKLMAEVFEYLKTTYGEDHLAKSPESPAELMGKLKDTKHYFYLFGSVREVEGKMMVPYFDWTHNQFNAYRELEALDEVGWSRDNRVVLLED